MSYPDKYDITKVYYKTFVERYMDAYRIVHENMKALYDDEQALAAGVNTAMIAISKGAGMDIAGVITWDTEDAGEAEDFKTFAQLKAEPAGSKQSQVGNYQKPQYGGGYRKQYDGPKELKGEATEKQVNMVHRFLSDSNPKIRNIATEFMANADVSEPEELSKQDASKLIDLCFAESGAGKGRK